MDLKAARKSAAYQGHGGTRSREADSAGEARRQQGQALHLTLYELRRTMALIAAQVHNSRFCRYEKGQSSQNQWTYADDRLGDLMLKFFERSIL